MIEKEQIVTIWEELETKGSLSCFEAQVLKLLLEERIRESGINLSKFGDYRKQVFPHDEWPPGSLVWDTKNQKILGVPFNFHELRLISWYWQQREHTYRYGLLVPSDDPGSKVSLNLACLSYIKTMVPDDEARQTIGSLFWINYQPVDFHQVPYGTVAVMKAHFREMHDNVLITDFYEVAQYITATDL